MMLAIMLAVLFALLTPINAHSWIEEMLAISPNGTFTGTPGYSRGNVLRTAKDYTDTKLVHLLPPASSKDISKVGDDDKMCKDTQQEQKQTEGSPRLKVSAGTPVALRYQENGHVTLPSNTPGKPNNRGTVYVYGTTEPKTGEKFVDVHKKWTEDGTGGDKRGVLLTKQNYDDGRCYQINDGEISKKRQKEFKFTADQTMGANLWCQTDVKIPTTAPSGKPYTLYWVWDWPTAKNEQYPNGKAETYTTCMDVDITADAGKSTKKAAKLQYKEGQDLAKAAIPDQFSAIAAAAESATTSKTTAKAAEATAKAAETTAKAADTSASTPAANAAEAQKVTVTEWKTSVSTVYVSSQPTPTP